MWSQVNRSVQPFGNLAQFGHWFLADYLMPILQTTAKGTKTTNEVDNEPVDANFPTGVVEVEVLIIEMHL